jgi:hypothetical protein
MSSQIIEVFDNKNNKTTTYESFHSWSPKQCKALVVWGTLIESSVGSGRLTKQVRNMIKLPPADFNICIFLKADVIKHVNSSYPIGWSIPFSGVAKNFIRSFSTKNPNPNNINLGSVHVLNPQFVSGFADGESSFLLVLLKALKIKQVDRFNFLSLSNYTSKI